MTETVEAVAPTPTNRSIAQRIADAGEAAMPRATLDAADFWTVRPDEPEDFAGNYPAAQRESE